VVEAETRLPEKATGATVLIASSVPKMKTHNGSAFFDKVMSVSPEASVEFF
jgi:hypothetical protein